MEQALAKLEAGESDGIRRGVPFARCQEGYLFKLGEHLVAFADRINVQPIRRISEDATTILDLNDETGRPELKGRLGQVEVWREKGVVLLKWNRLPEVA